MGLYTCSTLFWTYKENFVEGLDWNVNNFFNTAQTQQYTRLFSVYYFNRPT